MGGSAIGSSTAIVAVPAAAATEMSKRKPVKHHKVSMMVGWVRTGGEW